MATGIQHFFDKIDSKVSTPISSFFGDDQGRVVLLTSLLSLFSILPVGFHMVVLNVPQAVIQQSFNHSFSQLGIPLTQGSLSVIWSITVSCQALGALIGCGFVAKVESKYGTKTGMMVISNGVLLAASLLSSLSAFIPFAPFLMLGRILAGIHTGLTCALVPLFVQQIAPKRIKGSIACFIHIAASFGAAMGGILSLDFMLGGPNTWGILLLLPGFLAGAEIVASYWVPDTPNHLLQRGAYSEAIESIIFYYDVTRLFNEDEDIVQHYFDTVAELPPQAPFWTVIKRPEALKGILLGCVVSGTQVFSGSMASISYSSSMFKAVSFVDILVPFLPALGSIVSMILTIPALQLVESRGRRPVLLKTLFICIIADIFLLVFSLLSRDDWWASWAFGVAFLLYGIGYNMGTGPLAYFIPAELVGADAAASALGAAVATNWICSMFTTLTFYPLNVAFGGWSYLLFIIPTSFLTFILWLFLPETRYHYLEDPIQRRLLKELGPMSYGSFSEIA